MLQEVWQCKCLLASSEVSLPPADAGPPFSPACRFYFFVNIGSLLAVTVIVWVQVRWGWEGAGNLCCGLLLHAD